MYKVNLENLSSSENKVAFQDQCHVSNELKGQPEEAPTGQKEEF